MIYVIMALMLWGILISLIERVIEKKDDTCI